MELRVQLKICEGCGCLWYRALEHGNVYCHRCEAKLRDFSAPESRQRRGPSVRKPVMKVWTMAAAAGGAE
jgi:uncharacterized Zn finger protein (UPF0148 family)